MTILTISTMNYFAPWIFLQFFTIFDNFDHINKDNPSDLWYLRHTLQFGQFRSWMHDNLCYLTIKGEAAFAIFGMFWSLMPKTRQRIVQHLGLYFHTSTGYWVLQGLSMKIICAMSQGSFAFYFKITAEYIQNQELAINKKPI